jgi:hypothetical protein
MEENTFQINKLQSITMAWKMHFTGCPGREEIKVSELILDGAAVPTGATHC